jgi:hypothetical protein
MASKKKVSSRSTNRNKIRAARDWTLPANAKPALVLEKAVAATPDGGVRLLYSPSAVFMDGKEMLEAVAADLKAFLRAKAPVNKAHFALIEAFLAELEKVGVGENLLAGKAETVSEDALVAMREVVTARNALAARAGAVGIPLSHFDIRRGTGSPGALFNVATGVVQAAKVLVPDFDQPAVARALVADLEKAVEKLAGVAGLRTGSIQERAKLNKRKRLLVKAFYEYLLWLSAWGRVISGDDPETQRRWRLDKTFANQNKTAKGTLLEAVEHATSNNNDPDLMVG